MDLTSNPLSNLQLTNLTPPLLRCLPVQLSETTNYSEILSFEVPDFPSKDESTVKFDWITHNNSTYDTVSYFHSRIKNIVQSKSLSLFILTWKSVFPNHLSEDMNMPFLYSFLYATSGTQLTTLLPIYPLYQRNRYLLPNLHTSCWPQPSSFNLIISPFLLLNMVAISWSSTYPKYNLPFFDCLIQIRGTVWLFWLDASPSESWCDAF